MYYQDLSRGASVWTDRGPDHRRRFGGAGGAIAPPIILGIAAYGPDGPVRFILSDLDRYLKRDPYPLFASTYVKLNVKFSRSMDIVQIISTFAY